VEEAKADMGQLTRRRLWDKLKNSTNKKIEKKERRLIAKRRSMSGRLRSTLRNIVEAIVYNLSS
jgi:hypothetical protein